MASEDKILKVLLQIQSDLAGLKDLKTGIEDLKKTTDETAKSGFSLGDAFKFAGAEETLKGVLDVLKKVGEEFVSFVESSVKKSAELQAEAFPLTQLIGNSEKAKEIIGGLDSIWQQVGVVSNRALADGARNLLIIGTSVDNLIPRLLEMAKVHVATGIELNNIISAYERLKMAIANQTEPMIRGVGGFSAATIALLSALQSELGKSQSEILSMFKTGEISIQMLNKALRDSADTGGIFANAFEEKRKIFEGAVDAMRTAWQGFEQEIGTPIIDKISPIINEITKIERALSKIAEDHGWQVALEAAWELAIEKIEIITSQAIVELFTKIGPAAADAFFQGYIARLKNIFSGQVIKDALTGDIGKALMEAALPVDLEKFGQVLIEKLTGGAKQKIPELKKLLEDAIKSVSGTPILPPETEETLDKVNKSGKDLAAVLKQLETQLQAIHQEQQIIQQNPMLGVDEKAALLLQQYAREAQNLQATIARIQDFKSTHVLDPNQIGEADQKLQQANFQLDLLHLKLVGLQKPFTTDLIAWANSFGTASHQIAGAITSSLGTAIGGISQGLTGLIFQTKNWQQAFAQAIESIVANLIQMALQFVASRLLMAAINRAAGTADTSSATVQASAAFTAWEPAAVAASTASYGVAASVGLAAFLSAEAAGMAGAVATVLHSGGLVGAARRMHKGGLAEDEVPIIAQQDEIMIRRGVAQKYKSFLLALNSGMGIGAAMNYSGGRGGDSADFYPPGDMFGDPVPTWSDPPDLGQPPDPGPPSTTATGGDPNPFFDDFDPRTAAWLNTTWGGNPWASGFFPGLPSFTPPMGLPGSWQGPTMYPTFFDPQGYPYAQPVGPDANVIGNSHHTPPKISKHEGGLISRYHSGGPIFRSGVSGFRLSGRSNVAHVSRFSPGGQTTHVRDGGVHVYNFTDLKELSRHLASREGQKIIIDTIKGRRIDIGL